MKRHIASPKVKVEYTNRYGSEVYVPLSTYVDAVMTISNNGGQLESLQIQLEYLRSIVKGLVMSKVNKGDLTLWQLQQLIKKELRVPVL